MAEVLTRDKIVEIGEHVIRRAIALAQPEDIDESLRRRILENASPEERLEGITPAERRALLRLLQRELEGDAEEAENGDTGAA